MLPYKILEIQNKFVETGYRSVFVYGQRRKERMREYNDKKTQRNFGW
jgi:hypothetical protein